VRFRHFPLQQVWPLEHFWLQPPQLLTSVCVFTQVPLQQLGAVDGQGVPPLPLQPPEAA
jgi:hypothetical protein